jgi:hypothetical protein
LLASVGALKGQVVEDTGATFEEIFHARAGQGVQN